MANISQSTSQTSSVMVPKYEVKLLLIPSKALDSNNQLRQSIKGMFSVSTASQKMNVQFFDTNDKDIFKRDWNARIRRIEGENELELTYKKRYKITNGNIDAGLLQAAQDGFDSENRVFKAQIDWGFKNQTLSIHRDEFYPHIKENASDFSKEDAQRMLAEKAPERFMAEIDATFLQQTRIYGPVFVERFAGNYDDDDLDIELWPIRGINGKGFDQIVEVSFKVRDFAKAMKRRKELLELLKKEGLLLEEDSLRTVLIMERYKNVNSEPDV